MKRLLAYLPLIFLLGGGTAHVMENVPAGPGPYNSLAIGEVANVPTAAAVANAVADACGVRITDLPVTSEKVYRALKNGQSV